MTPYTTSFGRFIDTGARAWQSVVLPVYHVRRSYNDIETSWTSPRSGCLFESQDTDGTPRGVKRGGTGTRRPQTVTCVCPPGGTLLSRLLFLGLGRGGRPSIRDVGISLREKSGVLGPPPTPTLHFRGK